VIDFDPTVGQLLLNGEARLTDSNKIAIEALERRALDLIAERKGLRRRMLEDAARDAEIERDIFGCVSGARALEGEIALPPNAMANPGLQQQLNAFTTGRNAIAQVLPQLKKEYGLEVQANDDEEADAELAPEMPRIGEIILDRLKVAGSDGSKAAEIKRFILNTYEADIHEKTVGMTLYRLQKDGAVRRDGHVWFLASPEAENPGADTPGPAVSQP